MNTDVIARQPTSTDPAEQRIRTLLEEWVTPTDSSKQTLSKAKTQQKEFLQRAAGKIKTGEITEILGLYQEQLLALNSLLNTKITDGTEHLEKLHGRSFIIITNHLGLPKIGRFQDDDIYSGIEIEPFTMRHFAFGQITQETDTTLHEAAVELPGVLHDIQNASGVITINVLGEGRTEQLIKDTQNVIQKEASAVVMYPEGGTTGKRNGQSPYTLEHFHSGAFVVAKQLGIPVLPVCQYYNPNNGMELHVLPPIRLDERSDVKQIAEETQHAMQAKLNSILS